MTNTDFSKVLEPDTVVDVTIRGVRLFDYFKLVSPQNSGQLTVLEVGGVRYFLVADASKVSIVPAAQGAAEVSA